MFFFAALRLCVICFSREAAKSPRCYLWFLYLFFFLFSSLRLCAFACCFSFLAKPRSRQGVIYGFFIFSFSCFLLCVSAPLRAIFSRLKIHFLSFSLINLKKATKLERSKNHLCIIESFLPFFWHLLLVPV